ncbi:hypothetical protein [Cellulomonas marina]|uniref:Uncharacterized protein n=1 Tax=Cellulomonas marina TaxID=988821 RepID=A0A1I1AYZ6_9CELL|nr:hypothetical protein [Cellulomonas marina]SFB41658.1 hypothetical protein SAMN05421867_12314 [Cellulomonas marina]
MTASRPAQPDGRGRRTARAPLALALVGALLLALGLWLLCRPTYAASFGWTAYAPLSEAVFSPRPWRLWLGTALTPVATLLLGTALGWWWRGRRSR